MKNLFLLVLKVIFFTHLPALSQVNFGQVPALIKQNQIIPEKVIKSTREFRERLLLDPYRPAYHFCVPEDIAMPGDPNGAFYYNGRYHFDVSL